MTISTANSAARAIVAWPDGNEFGVVDWAISGRSAIRLSNVEVAADASTTKPAPSPTASRLRANATAAITTTNSRITGTEMTLRAVSDPNRSDSRTPPSAASSTRCPNGVNTATA